ncbi:hypothetical protein LCGC14_1494830 [marine sediment metagenome]|uniref:Uncharacterized protein n=1 Tax=marine sediment metagenome TaxID=412755 RepID=A0A0F9J5Q3_9ZZZZ
MEWRQERPVWCPHQDCLFQRRVQDALCGGHLLEPIPHDGDMNDHRICLHSEGRVDDFQVNNTDLGWLRWVLDALDGQSTSWLSRRGGE